MTDLYAFRKTKELMREKIHKLLSEGLSDSGNPIQRELNNRLKVLVWIYGKVIKNTDIVDQLDLNNEIMKIDTSVRTGNQVYDDFFRDFYSTEDFEWIRLFPDQKLLERYYLFWYVHEHSK